MKKFTTTIATIVLGFSLSITAQAKEAPGHAALLKSLAEGGKVILMRHSSTEAAEMEVSMRLSGDCSQEQNLSEDGRAEAALIAKSFQAHGIHIEKVYSSEYCRARETAEIAFGGSEAWHALNLAETMSTDDAAFLMLDVQEKMGDFAGKGVMVLISHRSNINTITFQQTEPSNMVILQPDGVGNTEVLGVLPVDVLGK